MMVLLALYALLALPIVLAQHATIYWPVLRPTPSSPWILGQVNTLAWRCATGMGVEAFDIQLHNYRSSMMDAPLKIAKNVPMARLTTGYRNFGGSIDIDLSDSSLRAGSGYVIAFVESLQGQVYSTSPVFSIVKEAPQNYTATPSGVAAPTVTATITAAPEAQDTWPITMDGKGATLSISYGS